MLAGSASCSKLGTTHQAQNVLLSSKPLLQDAYPQQHLAALLVELLHQALGQDAIEKDDQKKLW